MAQLPTLMLLLLTASARAGGDPAVNAERKQLYKEIMHWSLLARRDWKPAWQADWSAGAQSGMQHFAISLSELQYYASNANLDKPGLETLKTNFQLWQNRLCEYLFTHAPKSGAGPSDKAAFCATLRDAVDGLVERTIAWRGRRQAPPIVQARLASLERTVGSTTAAALFDKSRNLKDAVGAPIRPPARARARAALPPLLPSPFRTDLRTVVPSDGPQGDSERVGWDVKTTGTATGCSGYAWWGRLPNGVELPAKGEGYVSEGARWGTPQMIAGLKAVARDLFRVKAPTLVVYDVSKIGGGRLSGHASHQKGVDVDLPFIGGNGRGFNVAANWTLIASALAHMHVTYIFVDNYHKNLLLQHAKQLEGKGFISPEVRKAAQRVLWYWPGHGDHFHVRIA